MYKCIIYDSNSIKYKEEMELYKNKVSIYYKNCRNKSEVDSDNLRCIL